MKRRWEQRTMVIVQGPRCQTVHARIVALLEVGAVFTAVMLLLKAHMHLPVLGQWQRSALGHPFLRSIVCLVAPPLLVMKLTGLSAGVPSPSRTDLFRSCLIGVIPMMVLFPAGSAFGLLAILKLSWLSWPGAVILTLAYGLALPLVALVLRSRPSVPQYALHRRELAVLVAILFAAILLSSVTSRACPLIGSLLHAFLFVALAEELLARGYFQTRLNASFGRPFCVLGIRFGWGLFLSSCLFGLMHYLSPGDPFHLPWAIWVTVSSLIFGVIREKGGSFIPAAIAHGLMLLPKVLFSGP